jgi:BlaI family penicillinase repressor
MAQWFKTDITNLGHLERELLERLWKLGEGSVAAVHEELSGRLAYTTVMTTLDRLYKKGILVRRKEGRAFFYSAHFSREEFQQKLVKKALDQLLSEHDKQTTPLMAYLVEGFREHDERLLDELERMIRQSRDLARQKRGS